MTLNELVKLTTLRTTGPRSYNEDAQSDLSLHWAHMSEDIFSHYDKCFVISDSFTWFIANEPLILCCGCGLEMVSSEMDDGYSG